jgi:hypothetical protein
MAIRVQGEIAVPASANERGATTEMMEQYVDAGLGRAQYRFTVRESDYHNGREARYSEDNGRTWGPWQDVYAEDVYTMPGAAHEISCGDAGIHVYNPAHRHFVRQALRMVYVDGHIKANEQFWQGKSPGFYEHCELLVRDKVTDAPARIQMKFEPGADFDGDNPLNPNYLYRNCASYGDTAVARNGDILSAITPKVSACCRVLGIGPEEIFPVRPDFFGGLMVARGAWNGSSYDLAWSKPVILGDMQSSRGVDEPTIAELANGRVLVVFRGSNVRSPEWESRIEPGTPAFKWYTYSDDGGKTFSAPAPWHFDDGAVVYSSATISHFIRASRNGKLYWVGNITDHRVNGNWPRYPLQIVEVDERYGTAKRDTLAVIETKREGESERIQLSNFWMLDDRESGKIELYLTKYGQHGDESHDADYNCETWKYSIDVEGA